MTENETGKSIVGKVAAVVDNTTLVLNVGDDQGVAEGMVFSIVDQHEEIADPDTGESLGQWEVVKARVIVTHVQNRMCTVRSPLAKDVDASSTLSALMVRHSYGLYGHRDEEREGLQVRTSSMQGRPRGQSIQVGDVVRSVGSEALPEGESELDPSAQANPTAPDTPSGTYAVTPSSPPPDAADPAPGAAADPGAGAQDPEGESDAAGAPG